MEQPIAENQCEIEIRVGTDFIRCGAEASYSFRWGSDPVRRCCVACLATIYEGAERFKRTIYAWPIEMTIQQADAAGEVLLQKQSDGRVA